MPLRIIRFIAPLHPLHVQVGYILNQMPRQYADITRIELSNVIVV